MMRETRLLCHVTPWPYQQVRSCDKLKKHLLLYNACDHQTWDDSDL